MAPFQAAIGPFPDRGLRFARMITLAANRFPDRRRDYSVAETRGRSRDGGVDSTGLNYAAGMVATVAFAVTAVAALKDRRVDVFGVVVLGVITAIGGGTIRDVILQVPVFWVKDLNYLWVALVASLVAFFGRSLVTRGQTYTIMLYLDAFGAAMFAVQGMAKAWRLDFGLPAGPIILGVITAIGGGLLRDVLAGRPTLLMSREFYAVPLVIACSLFAAVLVWWPDLREMGAVGCVLVGFALRAATIHWKLAMPRWLLSR